MPRAEIRNVAIVAHVDHGKTTMVDQLLHQSGQFREGELKGDCIMDSNPIEKERGITILSKNCAIDYLDRSGRPFHINIVDTPGHADFSGEVERVLRMADGVLLLVDAFDGVMPQTRYVLSKALAAGLSPVVVVNKMDRPGARPEEVIEGVFDLFVELGADDRALDFPVVYASGREGWACTKLPRPAGHDGIHDLFDAIIHYVPAPCMEENAPLQALITTLDYSDYVGRIGIGRVFAGTLSKGLGVAVIARDGVVTKQKVGALHRFHGLSRTETDIIEAGDICAIVGLDPINIGDTVADAENPIPLPTVPIDEPTLHMNFRLNDGPFAGREGKYVNGRQLRDRLQKELKSNVALRVEDLGDEFRVSGRGLLHLGILLENMRREGFELTVGKPQVIFHFKDGICLEPIESLVVETPSGSTGPVVQLTGERRGRMLRMDVRNEMTYLEFDMPARGLIGLRNLVLNATQGEAIMHHRFKEYGEFRGPIESRKNGVMVAREGGQVTTYACEQLTGRGALFVQPGEAVYEGQLVGEHCRDDDLEVNIVRQKSLTNVRSATKEATVVLKTPRKLTLEYALEYIEEDELVEITPASVRLRKRHMKEIERRKASRARRSGSEN